MTQHLNMSIDDLRQTLVRNKASCLLYSGSRR